MTTEHVGGMRRLSSGCYSQSDPSELSSRACCLICMETLISPRCLDCHHIFCQSCLQLFYKIYRNIKYEQHGVFIPCPTCRKLSKVPAEGLSGLATASREDLAGQRKKYMQATDGLQECDVCIFKVRTVDSDYYCSKCSLNFCTSCKNAHDNHNLFKTHTTVHISSKETVSMYCEVHTKLQVIYFCLDCQQPICTVCVLQGHSTHQTVKLYEALGKRRENLKSILNTLWPKLDKLDVMVQKLMRLNTLSKRKNGVSMPSSPVLENVSRAVKREYMNKDDNGKSRSSPPILDSTKEHLFGREMIGHSSDDIEVVMTRSFQFHIERLKKLFDKSMKILEMSQSKKLIVIYDDLVSRLETVLDLELRHLQDEVSACLQKEKELYNLQNSSRGSTGDTIIPKQTSSTSLTSLPDRLLSVASSTTDTSPIEDCLFEMPQQHSSMLVQPQMLWKVEKQRNDLGELWNPCDVAFMQDGNLVVAEYDVLNDKNNKLRIFDQSGKSLETLAQGVIRPLGVAVTREGNIVVTDCKGKRVKLYTPSGQLMADIGKGQFGWPYGITTNSKGQIIVTDAFNDVINIYQSDGKRIKQFGSSGSNSNQFRNPYHVTHDLHDNIIVSDSGNNCFKVFDTNGEFLHRTCEEHRVSFGGEKPRRRGLKGPRGISTDLKGNILVADDRSRVAHYSGTGQYIRNLLTKEDSVKYPEALCCSSKGHLVVTEWNPNNMFAIKVFNLYE